MDKTALVLGGTKGIGRALSIEALKRGITPVVMGRSANDLKDDPQFKGAILYQADLTSAETVRALTSPSSGENSYALYADYIFWVAGIWRREPFALNTPEYIQQMFITHLLGPLVILRDLQRVRPILSTSKPYHLVTIASTSSYRLRNNETLYCAIKDFKTGFTRNFAQELARDLPGSKTTLINPGGIKTGLFNGSDQDISKFMNADEVARIIWNEVTEQEKFFHEVNIERDENGNPVVSYGPKTPEVPC